MLIVLQIDADHILEAKFQTYGCPAAISCGQYVTEQVQGKTFTEAASIDANAIITGVGQMPLGREHCPGMTANALHKALEQCPQA